MKSIALMTTVLLVWACSPDSAGSEGTGGPLGDSGAQACEHKTDAGFRICCGRETEIPEVSCVDLTVDGGEFGMYRKCVEMGRAFDAKFAGAQCCQGLARSEIIAPATGPLVDDAGCSVPMPPSVKTCLPCGNGVCDPGENRCNCTVDCAN
jgi:hypothetical protein